MGLGTSVETVHLSVLICTYNGASTISGLLASTIEQQAEDLRYEVVVVDNNSTDGTRDIVAEFIRAYPDKIRFLRQPQQGKSYALNQGLDVVRGGICCVIDQDEHLPPDYLSKVWAAFEQEPAISFLSGKVLPIWPSSVPPWITRDHWSPLAICDYGDRPFLVTEDRLICLLAGSFRTDAMRGVGGYRHELGISPGRLGSVEDADLYERLVYSGKVGRYIPDLVLYHKISTIRLNRKYHRRWHLGHGTYFADMKSPSFEASSRRILGVPGHVFRQALSDTAAIVKLALRGRFHEAFDHELRLRFFAGLISRRWGTFSKVGKEPANQSV